MLPRNITASTARAIKIAVRSESFSSFCRGNGEAFVKSAGNPLNFADLTAISSGGGSGCDPLVSGS